MHKKNLKLEIFIVSLIAIVTSVSYAYYSVIFKDTRTSDDNGNTSLKTCSVAQATMIDNIPDSVGSFSESDIYPGHKEVTSFSVTARGEIGSKTSFKFIYDITENGLGNGNVKVSVYKNKEEIIITNNYFNCQKTSEKVENETRFYETCETQELGTLIEETILTGGKETVEIGNDTLFVPKDNVDTTENYYVVIEFLNKENQNDYMNSTLNGSVRVELTTESIYRDCLLNGMDPVLKDELIPITIDNDGTVKKADITKEWYNYQTKEWANAVILKDESIIYNNEEVIPESNIESYFVWIPKYRYQLWDLGNYNGLTEIDNSKVHTIPLIFGDYNTSDEVDSECTTPMESGATGNCKVGDYMTHPAFLSIPSTGFWVGKFETSKSNTNVDNSINPDGVQIKPNVVSWRNIQVANAFYTTYDYKRNLDSHMMKNTEWGAVAYLQHSEYGSHTSVRINNNNNYVTGYASVNEPTCGYTDNRSCNKYGTTSDITLPYNTEIGYLASTTGNISGIYDMSGGAGEYVMGVMMDNNGNSLSGQNATYNSGFTGGYSQSGSLIVGNQWPLEKYYDKYAYFNTINSDQYQRRILGDATGEMGPYGNITYNVVTPLNSWYGDCTYFVDLLWVWFTRGSTKHNGNVSGIFTSAYNAGEVRDYVSFRVILTPSLQ